MILGVTLDGWLLSLHVLSAFAVVGGLTSLLIALAAGRRLTNADWAPPLRRVANVGAAALRAGLIGTLVFGLWLVLRLEGFSVWSGWVLGSLVLWLITGGLADRSIAQSRRILAGQPPPDEVGADTGLRVALRSRSLLWFRVVAFAAAVATLALMVWKPGT